MQGSHCFHLALSTMHCSHNCFHLVLSIICHCRWSEREQGGAIPYILTSLLQYSFRASQRHYSVKNSVTERPYLLGSSVAATVFPIATVFPVTRVRWSSPNFSHSLGVFSDPYPSLLNYRQNRFKKRCHAD